MKEYKGLAYNDDYTICKGFTGKETNIVELHPDTELIQEKAFWNKNNIEKVIINENLKKAFSAFANCKNLKEIIVNNKFVPNGTFSKCGNNEGINIYLNGVIAIGSDAFTGCFINNIDFSNSKYLERINVRAFIWTTFNKNVLYLPNSIKAIERNVFDNSNLTDIYMPDNLELLGNIYNCNVNIHITKKALYKTALSKRSGDEFEIVIEEEQNLNKMLDNLSFKEVNKLKLDKTQGIHNETI